MLHGIIFDMDGVLIDSHPVHRRAWRKFLSTIGKDVDEEELDFILEGRRRDEILRHFLGDLPATTAAEYGRRKNQLFQKHVHKAPLMPGIRPFLDAAEAAGIVTGIATSASSRRTWLTLHRLRLDKRFATVVTGDDVVAGKPDPAIYRLAAQRMNIGPSELLVLEDAVCGVEAAKSAGMRCIGIASNGQAENLRQAGADHVISNFLDFSTEQLLQLWITITRSNQSPHSLSIGGEAKSVRSDTSL